MKTYLIQLGETNLFKIGRSIDPDTRLCQLASGQPFEYKLIAMADEDIELKLHKQFAKYKHNSPNSREWFCFDEQTLRQVLIFYAEPRSLNKRAKQRAKPVDKAVVAELVCDILGIKCLAEPFDIVIKSEDIYRHPSFSELGTIFNKLGSARQTWFWRQCLKEYFGFNYKKAGNKAQGYKY